MRPAIHTMGHGTLPDARFADLVVGAGITRVVDIRSFPGSRRNPQFGQDAMRQWLPEHGLAYGWIRELGGRRRPSPESVHTSLRHSAFRAYADHMDTAEFRGGVTALLGLAKVEPVAVMCSESVWWRCHRRLLADHLQLLHDVQVSHLMPDGRIAAHPPTPGVRVTGDRLVYDAPA